MSQNKPCEYVPAVMQFIGSPVEQSRCLLRPNRIGGVLGEPLAVLPGPLEKLIGTNVKIKKEKLNAYLSKNQIDPMTIGGSLDEPLSMAKLRDGSVIPALYFIIHDTSTPYLKDEAFPADIDTNADWKGNNLNIWINSPVAHAFVNRLGASLTTTPFNENVRKGWGTKFARDFLREDGKGLQIHIELIQPRRRDPNGSPTNDRFAPLPGFSEKQYERLALLYVAASVRRGTWLIPGYHSAVDAGIKGAHDDPQNFELSKFAESLKKLVKKIS